MTTIDLSTRTQRRPGPVLEAMPRRLALTRAELDFLSRAAGSAPLPFDLHDTAATPQPGGLAGRLGDMPRRNDAYQEAIAALHDPEDSLRRRGLLHDGSVDANLLGAIGLLATPAYALEIDLATREAQVKAWHRTAGDAVATLSTADGIVFELAWFGVDQWAGELSRVGVLPEDLVLSESGVPEQFTLPFDFANAAAEAIRTHRHDLLPLLLSRTSGTVLSGDTAMSDTAAIAAATALHTEAQGRLRLLAASIHDDGNIPVGVVSWVLLKDGWHAVSARLGLGADGQHDDPVIVCTRVAADDLPTELAPILAEVAR